MTQDRKVLGSKPARQSIFKFDTSLSRESKKSKILKVIKSRFNILAKLKTNPNDS